MGPDVSDQRIAELLRDAYGLEPRAITLQRARAYSSAYAIVADQRDYFLKLSSGAEAAEALEVQRLLAETDGVPVVAPVTASNQQLSTPMEDLIAVVYPFVEGRTGFAAHLREDQWIAFGAALRRIHAVAVPHNLGSAIRNETYTSQWRDRVRTMLSVVTATGEGDAPARELSAFIVARRKQLAAIVERSEELAARVLEKSLPLVLCHGDLHAGNVMVAPDDQLTIVDWDDPVMAPRERDLMFVGAGVGGVWNQPRESEAFLPPAASRWRHRARPQSAGLPRCI